MLNQSKWVVSVYMRLTEAVCGTMRVNSSMSINFQLSHFANYQFQHLNPKWLPINVNDVDVEEFISEMRCQLIIPKPIERLSRIEMGVKQKQKTSMRSDWCPLKKLLGRLIGEIFKVGWIVFDLMVCLEIVIKFLPFDGIQEKLD